MGCKWKITVFEIRFDGDEKNHLEAIEEHIYKNENAAERKWLELMKENEDSELLCKIETVPDAK